MPLQPLHQLRAIELSFRSVPGEAMTPEQHKVVALTSINYAGSLGRALTFMAPAQVLADGLGQNDQKALLEDLGPTLFVLGEFIAALSEHAYMSVEEMHTAILKEQGRGVESPSSGSENT